MGNALGIGQQAVGAAVSGIIGIGSDAIASGRQYRQQTKLMEKQVENQKALTDYNAARQLQMWKDTNYSAQMEELEKAGLNPALLYGMSGGGGATTGGGAPSAAGGSVSAQNSVVGAMGIGLQMGMMEAQKRVLETQADKNEAEANKTKGVDTQESIARTDNLMQGLDNLRADFEIKRLQQTMMNIENYEKQASQGDRLDYIEYQTKTALRMLKTLNNEGKISDATIGEKIQIVQNEAIYGILKNELTKASTDKTLSDIDVNKQRIKESIQKLMIEWDSLSNENRKVQLQRIMTDYNTAISPETKIGMEVVEQAVDGILRGMIKK